MAVANNMFCQASVYRFINILKCSHLTYLKDEYHANENPLKHSEKKCICWSKVNVSNNQNRIIPYHASFFYNAIKFKSF